MTLDTLSGAEKQQLVDAFYWYHTIDFGGGVRSRGTVDHAPVFARYGFPSVAGQSVLDVGSSDGYFAFEFERLGASRVVAVDVDRWAPDPEFDFPQRTRERRLRKYRPKAGEEATYAERERIARELGLDRPDPFLLAKALKGSHAERVYASAYDLPQSGGPFDVVFLGTVTTLIQNIPGAFEALRHVTKRQAVIACAGMLDQEPLRGRGWAAFSAIRLLRWIGGVGDHVLIAREAPVALYGANEGGAIWRPSVECIREMLLSAGFRDVSVFSRFNLPNDRRGTSMDHVVFHAFV